MQPEHVTESFSHETQLEQCHDYILSQLQIGKKPSPIHDPAQPGPTITISYQTGSGEHEVAGRLGEILQAAEPKEKIRWTVFDRHLVEKVLEEHHLPQSLAMILKEDRRTYVEDLIAALSGVRPPSWVVVRQVAETVLHLAYAGHVILVGRGANFITARMPNVFHVHLVAPLPARIARVQKLNGLTLTEATKLVAESDRGRGRYVNAHFHVRLDNDLLYHVAINTARIAPPEAAQLIADGARTCFQTATASPVLDRKRGKGTS